MLLPNVECPVPKDTITLSAEQVTLLTEDVVDQSME